MQDDIQYPQYAISLAHGGIVKFFSSAESSESCAVTPDRNAAAHFGTKEAAAATIRWCVPLRTAEAEIVEIDSVKENREDFRRVLTENSVRVNARAFRDELSKKIESSKREGITVVLTRHGK